MVVVVAVHELLLPTERLEVLLHSEPDIAVGGCPAGSELNVGWACLVAVHYEVIGDEL